MGKKYHEKLPSSLNEYFYNFLQNRRENSWVKKIKNNADGLMIIGADHLESVSDKLNKINITTETVYDIRKERN